MKKKNDRTVKPGGYVEGKKTETKIPPIVARIAFGYRIGGMTAARRFA